MHPPTGRLPGLDLLRSVAIVGVMLFHAFVVGGLGPHWNWLSRYGWMGVDLFSVLSGFLIGAQVLATLQATGRLPLRDFYLRRAFRILPAYGFVLLCYAWWPAFHEAPGMAPAWKFLAFVVNLDIDYARTPAFSHAWSLCVEEHFYLLFPGLALLFMRRPSLPGFAAACACTVLAGIGLRTAIWVHDMNADPEFVRNWYIEDIYSPTWNRLDGLLVGVALAAWKVLRPTSWAKARRRADLALVLGVAGLGLSLWLFRDRVGLLGNAVGWPVLALTCGLWVFAAAGRDSLLGRRAVPGTRWLAAVSYSLYLVHKPVYHLVQSAWGAELDGKGLMAFAVYGIAAIAAGAALHGAVEQPFLGLRDRLARRRRVGAPRGAV